MIARSSKFGPFELSPERHLLLKDGKPVRLGSRAIEILIVLVQHAGQLVRYGELIAHIWPGITVEDSNLRVHVGSLRHALGDGQRGIRYILTESGRGYRFVGELRSDSAQTPDAGIQAKNEPRIQLPALLTRLVGRDKEIESVVKQLRLHRLVTIVGPGGIGKSSVGLAAAWDLAAGYPDGCVFVDLAALVASGLVASTMATLMHLPVCTATPLPALVGFLGDKRFLLVLDSCEHLVEEVAVVAESILRGAPHVDILATSREPLRIEGEWLQRLRPLAIPPTGGDMTAAQALTFPAIVLFAERALANIDTFDLTDAEAPLLAVLCQKLDGIPLAIELAAARIDSLGIRGLVAGLDDRLSLLNNGRRTALPRQRTLRATLDWSYGLLSELERAVFCRLSIFNGPFSSATASNVCGDSHIGYSDVQEAILNLAAKSLITTDVSGDMILYRLLDTTRAYAKEILDKSPQRSMVARRHAEALCRLLRAVEGEPTDSRENPDRRVIDDVRAALEWAFSGDGDVVIAVNLTALSSNLWFHFSLLEENKRRIERALALLANMESADTELEIQLRVAYGHAVWHTTVQADIMEASFSGALTLAERSKCARLQLLPLWHLWNARNLSGNYESSAAVARRFGQIVGELNDSANILTHARMLGLSSHYQGKYQIARSLAERVLGNPATMNDGARKREFQFDQRVAARSLLARTLWLQGFPDQALRMAKACIEDAIALQHDMSLCYAIIQSGCPVCAWAGDLQTANSFLTTLLESSTKWSVLYWNWWAKSYKIVFASIGQADMISAWAHHVRGLTFIPLILETIGTLRSELIDPRVLPTTENARDTGWATPELLRGSGETCLRSGDPGCEQGAEDRFRSAFDIARQQGALSWELRAATSLARLWQTQGRRDDAQRILRGTFSRFSEGFGTADLRQASRLLEELDNDPRTTSTWKPGGTTAGDLTDVLSEASR